jgi:Hint domain
MKPAFGILLLCTALLAAGCLAPGGGGPTSTPTPMTTLTPAQLKYRLLDNYGESRFFFCDPDSYPVARGDEQARAIETFPLIANETGVLAAITARKGLQAPFSDGAKLVIYREYKKLNAIPLEPAGDGTYTFSLRLGNTTAGVQVSGTIRNDGTILGERFETAFLTCPICLTRGTLIDTPAGPVPVENIREGMTVWTFKPAGEREAVPVLKVKKIRVQDGYPMVHLSLSDGRELFASPGHPLPDGRTLGSLAVGDGVDGAAVIGADLVPYGGGFTCDILPAGESGGYWANGIPLKSTFS